MNMNHKQLFISFFSLFAAVIPAGGYSLSKKTDESNPITFAESKSPADWPQTTTDKISFKYCGKNPSGQQVYLVAAQDYIFDSNDDGGLSNICNGDLSGNLAKNTNIQVVKVEDGVALLVASPPSSAVGWFSNIDTTKGDITYDTCGQEFKISDLKKPVVTENSTCKNGGGTPTSLTNYMMCNWRWKRPDYTEVGSVKKGCADYIGP
jgi:hypothetical protein